MLSVRNAMLVVCLGACNQVYGLDKTHVRDAFEPILDDDKDGIADDRGDNCVGVMNTDQLDADEDGKGDACDTCAFCAPCAIGPEHDEDGDRVADGCDNCPAHANTAQANADGDDLGDACDPSAAVHRRLLFDGFATLSSDWLPTGGAWDAVDDAAGPASTSVGVPYGLSHASVRLPTGTTWFVEVGIASAPTEEQGVTIRSSPGTLDCIVTPGGANGYRLNNSGIVDQTSFPFPATARLRYAAAGPINAQDPDCQLLGIASRQQGIVYQLSYPLTFTLSVHGAGRFTYVDVIGP